MRKPKRTPRKTKSLQRQISEEIASTLKRAAPASSPWWCGTETPIRPRSIRGSAFHGINTVRLWCVARDRGFTSPTWATADQWMLRGQRPAPWESPVAAVVYRPLRIATTRRGYPSIVRIIRPLMLFNANQLMHSAFRSICPTPRISIHHLFDLLAFHCTHELAGEQVVNDTHTLLSALVTWTGAPERLARRTWHRERSGAAVREEMIAELGAAYISADFGVDAQPDYRFIDTSRWVQLLRQDPRAVFAIAADAERAAQFVRRMKREQMLQWARRPSID